MDWGGVELKHLGLNLYGEICMPRKNRASLRGNTPARRNTHTSQTTYFDLLKLFLVMLVLPVFYYLFRQTPKESPVDLSLPLTTSPVNPDCAEFQNYTYNSETYRRIEVTLIGEIHGGIFNNRPEVVKCLASLVNKGDHLLLETPDNDGKEIPRDQLDPLFQQFNHKLKCYGFDVKLDEERRRTLDLHARSIFFKANSRALFENMQSGQDVINRLKDYAVYISNISSSALPSSYSTEVVPDASQRVSKYLIRLANKMRGLNISEMKKFISEEERRVNQILDEHMEKRLEVIDEKLTKLISSHQQQLTGTRNRLFVNGGALHVHPKYNERLNQLLIKESASILIPKIFDAYYAAATHFNRNY